MFVPDLKLNNMEKLICIGCGEYIGYNNQSDKFKKTDCCQSCEDQKFFGKEWLANDSIEVDLCDISECSQEEIEMYFELHNIQGVNKAAKWSAFYRWKKDYAKTMADYEFLETIFDTYLQGVLLF